MALRLGVSVSSYYDYRSCRYIRREVRKAVLAENIRKHFYLCRELYGSRRLSDELKGHGTRASHTTVARYMHKMGLRSKFYRKYRVTTDSTYSNDVAENLVDRDFRPT